MGRAARQPINVAMLVLMIFAGFVVDWRLFVLGAIFYVIMLIVMIIHLAEFDVE